MSPETKEIWPEVPRTKSRFVAKIVVSKDLSLGALVDITEGAHLGESYIHIPLEFDKDGYTTVGIPGVETERQELTKFNKQQLGETKAGDLIEDILHIEWGNRVDGLEGGSYACPRYFDANISVELKPTDQQREKFHGRHPTDISTTEKMQILAELFEERTGFKLEPFDLSSIPTP